MEPETIDFLEGHVCRVVYTRNDELMYLHCECSNDPVFVFEYPPSQNPDTSRPSMDEIRSAVSEHYDKLDVT